MDANQKKMMTYALLAIGVFLLAAPPSYQMAIPVRMDSSTRQMVACAALLAAYYFYNGEKLF